MGESVEILAALIGGDRWLSADGCAAFLGLFRANGEPNRRRFLERVASRPDFPARNPVTGAWKKSGVVPTISPRPARTNTRRPPSG